MITKKRLKTRPVCKVTFTLSEKEANFAKKANIVGDFNKWDSDATPMKRLKKGVFTTTVDFEQGKEHQFRYLLDDTDWENDPTADKFVPTPYGDSENSVIIA